jgi:hypothetical protein
MHDKIAELGIRYFLPYSLITYSATSMYQFAIATPLLFWIVQYAIHYALGEVDFFIFFIFNFLHFAIDGKPNSKTKVEKVFFFIFMSSYAEMSVIKQKITK